MKSIHRIIQQFLDGNKDMHIEHHSYTKDHFASPHFNFTQCSRLFAVLFFFFFAISLSSTDYRAPQLCLATGRNLGAEMCVYMEVLVWYTPLCNFWGKSAWCLICLKLNDKSLNHRDMRCPLSRTALAHRSKHLDLSHFVQTGPDRYSERQRKIKWFSTGRFKYRKGKFSLIIQGGKCNSVIAF